MESVPVKRCKKCGEEKPASVEFFTLAKRGLHGVSTVCKPCRAMLARLARQENSGRPKVKRAEMIASHLVSEGMRRCTKCQTVKPDTLDFFLVRDGAKVAQCKECLYSASRKCHEKNREHVREVKRQYREKHRDYILVKKSEWQKANPERRRLARQKWATANPEAMKSCRINWEKANPEKKRANIRNYKARKRAASGKHSAADILLKMEQQEGKCYWCGKQVGNSYHADHIIALAKGGSNGPENICISCPECNYSKNAKMPWDFIGRLL